MNKTHARHIANMMCRNFFSFRRKGVTLFLWCTPILFCGAQSPTISPALDFDLTFENTHKGAPFTATNGTISISDGHLVFSFRKGGVLHAPPFKNSYKQRCNPTLELRNTIMFVMENKSSSDSLRVRFTTEEDSIFDDKKSNTFTLEPYSAKQAYYFNLSDVPAAKGRLTGLCVEPIGGEGELRIDRITFEQEQPRNPQSGTILAC